MNKDKFDERIRRKKDKIRIKNEKKAAKAAKQHTANSIDEIAQEQSSNLPATEPKGIKKMFQKIAVRLGIGASLLASIGSVSAAIKSENTQDSIDNNTKTEADNEKNDIDTNERLEDFMKRSKINYADIGIEEVDVKDEDLEDIKEEQTDFIQNLQDGVKRTSADVMDVPNAQNVQEQAREKIGLKEGELTPDKSVAATVVSEVATNKSPDKETNKIEKETGKKEVQTITFADNKESNTQKEKNDTKIEEETTKTIVTESTNANISASTVTNKEEAIVVTIEEDGNVHATLADGEGTKISLDGKLESAEAPDDPNKIVADKKEEQFKYDNNGFAADPKTPEGFEDELER